MSAVSGTSDSLSVSWTAPNATGRPAIDDYNVRWFKGRADPATDSEWTSHAHSGTATSTTITGLDSGSAYRVQVQAGNAEGDGGWSPSGTGSTFANANPVFPTSTPSEFTVDGEQRRGWDGGHDGGDGSRRRRADLLAGCRVGRGVRHQCQRGDHGDQPRTR